MKHINEDISYVIYFDPSKYSVKDGYDGDWYSLLCNNIATTAIQDGYHIIKNEYYSICSSTAQRCSCNRCVPYKGDMKHRCSKTFRSKRFHHDAKNTCGLQGKNMGWKTITQRATNYKCKSSLFCNQIWLFWNLFGSQSRQSISLQSSKAIKRIDHILTTFVKQWYQNHNRQNIISWW